VAACAGIVAAMAPPASARPAPSASSGTRAAHSVARLHTLGLDSYQVVNLVSDQPGKAKLKDAKLKNAWGLAFGPSSPLWVANNHTATSTLYSGGGVHQTLTKVPLVVKIPHGDPTGQVFNGTTGFKLKNGDPAKFIFDSESGHVTGWNAGTSAQTVYSAANANYKGLALLAARHTEWLLAADFRHNTILILNSKFKKVSFGARAFKDSKLPKGYAPFNVAVIGTKVVVTYAKQGAGKDDDVAGAHHGFVDVYSEAGILQKRLIKGGALNSPWGLAVAPSGFGGLKGRLLVGNFGNGRINAYSLNTGKFVTFLHTTHGAVTIPGLWALLPGNGVAGAKSDLWFSAGPGGEAHGLLGIIRLAG
jgi:uncharacterized protein (TIGR03118 family)